MLLYLSSNFYYRICKRKQNGKTQLAVIRKLDDIEVTDFTKDLGTKLENDSAESAESKQITIMLKTSVSGYQIQWKIGDGPVEDAGIYSIRFLCTEIENRCFTGTLIGVYAASHESAKSESIMEVTDFEVIAGQSLLK